MTVFCDTSVFVAAHWSGHAQHEQAWRIVDGVLHGTDTGYLAAHSLAETYAVLTRLPVAPRISPSEAWQMIRETVIGHFQVVPLTSAHYADVLESLARRGIGGGQSYDALLLHAAEQVVLDRIYTLNVEHFIKLAPHLAPKIAPP